MEDNRLLIFLYLSLSLSLSLSRPPSFSLSLCYILIDNQISKLKVYIITTIFLLTFPNMDNLSILLMDILLLGCCTRFSCTLKKWYSQLAKITIPSIHPLYPIPSPPNGWTNKWGPYYQSKLHKFFPLNISTYSISIIILDYISYK